jgi:pantoate--beta-alanine ligase
LAGVRVIQTIAELRGALSSRQGVALVPTMGNLHAGHLSLVKIARESSDCVVTSIFVNPLQFAPHEDYAQYPRTFEQDKALLSGSGCDIVFAPSVQEIYPEGQCFTVNPPAGLADILEGSVRPGFFTGVCTVVNKFLNIVRPAIAVFGRKDYQQQLIIRHMVRQFAFPVNIMVGDIIRDAHGLALSSRNGYLTESQRGAATQLYETLQSMSNEVRGGRTDWSLIEAAAVQHLKARGWQPDYLSIRLRKHLSEPKPGVSPSMGELVILGAATLGKTRLIDNIEL